MSGDGPGAGEARALEGQDGAHPPQAGQRPPGRDRLRGQAQPGQEHDHKQEQDKGNFVQSAEEV